MNVMNVVNVTNKKDLHILSSGMQLFAIDGETEKAYLLKIRGEWVPNHDHPKSISKLRRCVSLVHFEKCKLRIHF